MTSGLPEWLARGCSSDGRALQSHCRGQGFDSPQLHQPPALKTKDFFDPPVRGGTCSVSQVYRTLIGCELGCCSQPLQTRGLPAICGIMPSPASSLHDLTNQ